jgi:hypothetical protein
LPGSRLYALGNLGYARRELIGIYLGRKPSVSTTKQKEAAKKNITKARTIQSERAHGIKIPRQTRGLSTAQQDKLPDSAFAFPKERKEPLVDAKHVRNAIARFDQVEGVSDKEKDAAWKRIMKAAKMCDVDIHESTWRELGHPSKSSSSRKTTASKSSTGSKASTASKTRPASKASTSSRTISARKTGSTSRTISASKTGSISKPSSARKTTSSSKTTSARKPASAKK